MSNTGPFVSMSPNAASAGQNSTSEGRPDPENAPCEAAGEDINLRTVKRYIISDYDTLNPRGLPENWVMIRHDSGIMLYLHQLTRVVTLSRPFTIGSESIRCQQIPMFAIPCLNYLQRKANETACSDGSMQSQNYTSKPAKEESATRSQVVEEDGSTAQVTKASPPSPIEGLGEDEADDEEDGSDGGDSEKEEGELTSDEDDEMVNADDYDGPPPSKRPLLSEEMSENSDTDGKADGDGLVLEESTYAGQKETMAKRTSRIKRKVYNDMENAKLLSPEEVREYCRKLFNFHEENAVAFRNRWERLRFYRMKKANRKTTTTTTVAGTGDGTDDPEACAMRQRAKERVLSLIGKSPVCVLHEYCQNVLRVQVTFKPSVVEHDKLLFRYAVVVNDVTYPTGSGSSKKAARSEAARLALLELLPEYKELWDARTQNTSHASESSANALPDADLEAFRSIGITDKQVYELTSANRLSCASPYTIFCEYIKRHCIPEGDVQSKMTPLGRNRHRFELSLGEFNVKVQCRNKRIGRHHAAQQMLALLHPQLKTWADLLELYGPNSKPDKKCDSEAILDAQARNSSSVKTGLIRLLRAKMLELSEQWENNEDAKRKGKFSVSPYNLPVISFHPDSTTTTYSSTPIDQPSSPSLTPCESSEPQN
ncbi:unnamed protein product [Mesocestoides corti]|uniref:DRBM domain-containing protein n=3 Tax=Mesocestoides corti TaxID=53468 RepID=A0A0R3UIS0_MESCO|nr:unnamed protein product [Mesocestoides corti]